MGDITKQSLRESEETVRALLESSTQAILASNEAGLVTIANATAERMFDYAQSELIGMPMKQLVLEPFRIGHEDLRASLFRSPASSQ